MYWGGLASASLFVHLSVVKQMSDGDAMWTFSGYFPGCLRPRLIGAEGAKGANVGGACIGSACIGGASIGVACDVGACRLSIARRD